MVIDDNRPQGRHENFTFSPESKKQKDFALAHPLDRLAAFLIDAGVLFLVCSLLVSPIQKKIKAAQLVEQSGQVVVLCLIALLMLGFLSVFYQAVCNAWKGATIGKMVFGLRVVDIWTEKKPNWSDSFFRGVTWWLDTVLLCLPHFGMYSDPQRRPFHDRVSNTVVVTIRGRRGKAPDASEVVFVRVMFVAIYFLGFAVLFQEFRHVVAVLEADDSADLLSMISPVQCEQVGDAMKSWPLENSTTPKRISVALSLFAAGAIEESCLDQEAFFEFRNGDQRELAYLARAFSTSDESDLSDRYLEKVCQVDEKSEACQFSHVISAWTERDWDTASAGFNAMLPSASVYVKTWAIKHFEKIKDYHKEFALIEGLWPLPGLSDFLASHRAISLWGMNRKEESRVAIRSAIENVQKDKQLGLAGWMCFNELDESCVPGGTPICSLFESLVSDASSAVSQDLFALTHLKVSECQKKLNPTTLAEEVDNPEVVELAKVISNERGELSEAEQDQLYDILDKSEDGGALAYDVSRRLMRATHDPNLLDEFLARWVQSQPFELWNWAGYGEGLLSAYMRVKKYAEAVKVGSRLLLFEPENENASHLLVVAAYKANNLDLARKLLVSFDAKRSNRAPASLDEYEEVKRALRQERGQ